MICTMNDYDKLPLNELSYGLWRRYAFVEIDILNDKEKLKKVVIERADNDLSHLAESTVIQNLNENDFIITKLIDFVYAINEKRKLGVSTVIDVLRYVLVGNIITKEENGWFLLNEAMVDYILPQFDRLDIDTRAG